MFQSIFPLKRLNPHGHGHWSATHFGRRVSSSASFHTTWLFNLSSPLFLFPGVFILLSRLQYFFTEGYKYSVQLLYMGQSGCSRWPSLIPILHQCTAVLGHMWVCMYVTLLARLPLWLLQLWLILFSERSHRKVTVTCNCSTGLVGGTQKPMEKGIFFSFLSNKAAKHGCVKDKLGTSFEPLTNWRNFGPWWHGTAREHPGAWSHQTGLDSILLCLPTVSSVDLQRHDSPVLYKLTPLLGGHWMLELVLSKQGSPRGTSSSRSQQQPSRLLSRQSDQSWMALVQIHHGNDVQSVEIPSIELPPSTMPSVKLLFQREPETRIVAGILPLLQWDRGLLYAFVLIPKVRKDNASIIIVAS